MIRALLAAALLLPASALAQPRSEVWLVNATGRTIGRLAVVPAGARSDAPQEAIAEPMAPGQSVRVMPGFPGCRMNILIEFAEGGRGLARNRDTCRARQIVLRQTDVEGPDVAPPPPGLNGLPAPLDSLRGPTRGTRIEPPSPWGVESPNRSPGSVR